MKKIFISTYPFCRLDETPMRLLREQGYEIILNPYSRKLKSSEVAELAKDCDAIVAGTEDLLPLVEQSKHLKLISRVGIGLDSVPLELCKQKGVCVAYTPDAVTPAVAELTVGLILDVFRQVTFADRELRRYGWSRPYGRRIATSTIGIIGFGRIGSMVGRLLTSFQPKEILVNDIKDVSAAIQIIKDKSISIKQTTKEEVYKNSDLITLHVPKEDSTLNLLSKKEFEQMKKSAYIINTSRGGIVNESDLENALKNNQIAGAALDVFEQEPYTGPLLNLESVVFTQHMGSCSDDCRADMEREAVEEVVRFFSDVQLKNGVV